ncbi:AT-rich interactive domain-containing protein 2-like [Culex quinquefasciatus]|uniref:AT-rich interactive domain-containing protein 2-like n=1 Tax=Culex quinquefasciatus TaxID=7176 RepID=UPI0018E332E7|nr:AT-rich interactive domain-containing protein 2-like [Culex quinquefasciatus]
MGGRNVDSNRLYSVMVTRGWWLNVDSREDWDEIIEEMALPTRCVNKEIALKKNNIRFLDKYEKGSDEEEDGKKRHNRSNFPPTNAHIAAAQLQLGTASIKNLCHCGRRMK